MKTLVYFASGRYREVYQKLNFDRIYLIDNCFKSREKDVQSISTIGKVTCVGMDSLKAIDFLKRKKIKIDCFVALNEGLYEGGGRYAINSDFFLGYAMSLMKTSYIHILNKNYYHHNFKVSMDLPYKMEEILENDNRYLSPFIFSKNDYHKEHAKVYLMNKISTKKDIIINPKIKLSIIHDSIWNYYDQLELIVISIKNQGQGNFFEKIPKVVNINDITIDQIFENCINKKISKIGFTPWGKGNYKIFIKKIETFKESYPSEIQLFHLNKNDYKAIKEYVDNKSYT